LYIGKQLRFTFVYGSVCHFSILQDAADAMTHVLRDACDQAVDAAMCACSQMALCVMYLLVIALNAHNLWCTHDCVTEN